MSITNLVKQKTLFSWGEIADVPNRLELVLEGAIMLNRVSK